MSNLGLKLCASVDCHTLQCCASRKGVSYLRFEAHIKHSVGFVKDEISYIGKLQYTHAGQIIAPAWRCNNNVASILNVPALGRFGCSTIYTKRIIDNVSLGEIPQQGRSRKNENENFRLTRLRRSYQNGKTFGLHFLFGR
jgi:hypothetical protein